MSINTQDKNALRQNRQDIFDLKEQNAQQQMEDGSRIKFARFSAGSGPQCHDDDPECIGTGGQAAGSCAQSLGRRRTAGCGTG